MKTLLDLSLEDSAFFAQMANQANKQGKKLSAENEKLVLIDFEQEPNLDLTEKIRLKRNYLLAQSDWTQGNDSPLHIEKKRKWAEYRQALRDITLQAEFPNNVIFPSTPV